MVLKWILCFCVLVSAYPGFAAREIPVISSRSLRQQVDSYAELLEKEVEMVKNNRLRFKTLKFVVEKIRGLTSGEQTQESADHEHVSLTLSVLEAIPSEKRFKKSNCHEYLGEFASRFGASSEAGLKEPAAEPAWKFLNSVCN